MVHPISPSLMNSWHKLETLHMLILTVKLVALGNAWGIGKAHLRGCLWGCLQRLDHEGNDLINGLIPWWIHNMRALLGGGQRQEVEPGWRTWVTGVCPQGLLLTPAPCRIPFLFPGHQDVNYSDLPHHSCHDGLAPWNHEQNKSFLP
jgi:hypothetical protein